MNVELYVSRACGYCAQLRERLEWDGVAFVEYDVDADANARARLTALLGASAMVPALVEDGRVAELGVGGRGCYVSSR
jgi:glutaredoxin 3